MTLIPDFDLDGYCGCDIPEDRRLISVDEAIRRGLALAAAVEGTETVPLAEAVGRVLAGPVTTPLPLPPFDNSAMDGYGLRLSDLAGDGPWILPVTGRIAAGDPGGDALPPGAALRILTGAPVPEGIEAIVMQEQVERRGDAIRLDHRPRRGLNIRRAGEDLGAGETILPGGIEIGPREAAALAAVGAAAAVVRRPVRVALFCTGSELRQPGEALGPGQIWNSNRFMLRAALARPWIALTDLGAVPDVPETLAATLRAAAGEADLVISTGGVSVGDEDHMPRILRAAGGDIHALRIAMKPGKPLALGRMGGAVYLGLPGNPVAAFTAWSIIGERIARACAGLTATAPKHGLAVAGFDLDRRPGRCEFRPARIIGRDGRGAEVVELLAPSFSARIALLARADGLALLPAETERIRAGDLLDFLPLP